MKLLAWAGSSRHCPICKHSFRRFSSVGRPRRPDALCINCGSLERHRLVWLFLNAHPELTQGNGLRLLHVAPEPCLEAPLRKLAGSGYLSADRTSPLAMEAMDICNMDYPDESFDAIYCSHVLEHVEDDRKAMHEFSRVLRRKGWAIVMVPIFAGNTFEDPAIVDPKERFVAFGQEDHVRRYGEDFADRLAEAGFVVREYERADLLTAAEIQRFGVGSAAGSIFFCRRSQ